jgi:hypothetical protein
MAVKLVTGNNEGHIFTDGPDDVYMDISFPSSYSAFGQVAINDIRLTREIALIDK